MKTKGYEPPSIEKHHLHIQLDFLCDLGYVSKLVSVLRTANLNPRQVSYDFIRVHYKIDLARALKEISVLCELLEKNITLWREMCIETWVEVIAREASKPRSSNVARFNSILVYIKPGSGKRVYHKLIWLTNIEAVREIILPESTTRFCIQSRDVEVLKKTCKCVEKFIQHYI